MTEGELTVLGIPPARFRNLQAKYKAEYHFAEGSVDSRVLHFVNKDAGSEVPVMLVDLGAVVRQMARWKKQLPNVQPYYAMKCNNNPALLELLDLMGCGFDCASKREFMDAIEMGFATERIIFANPCKPVTDIKAARAEGVKMCTFDNEFELSKLQKNWPEAKLILRIWADDNESVCQFSNKFGAPPKQCVTLLKKAKEMGLNIIGVSFHVGSNCGDAKSFQKALEKAHDVWLEGEKLGFSMQIMDIGGGFPGKENDPLFEKICASIRPLLEEYFPRAKIIAEPGRYFATASHTLAVNVYAKRELDDDDGRVEQQLYVSDGLYQSFNCLVYDHARVQAHPLRLTPNEETTEVPTTIFGPTCDGLDCIAKCIPFPNMSLGDWIYFNDMGAYTLVAASAFNGFYQWRVEYLTTVKF
eukprot:TRINITY_DN34219_c0_g1_i1.p1 TRINITY_DN34219_c0_g1~~TRINITY_DN34219_c0_g1_i1.p1  ORF type:complete len:414 (-),score=68.32 TRINITY_DN34219_c0_g1_i1:63-1304(-)